MMGFGELLGLAVVAPHTILGRHERRDQESFVIVGVRFALLRPMTFHAADALRRMAADFPVVDAPDSHVLGHVAIDALLVLPGHEWTQPSASTLFDLDV